MKGKVPSRKELVALIVNLLAHGYLPVPLIVFYNHMRNLSVFISNLDLDFAQVIELFWFKFYRSNLGIYTIVDRNSCQELLRMLTYRTYVITNTQNFLSDRMAMRRVDGYKKS